MNRKVMGMILAGLLSLSIPAGALFAAEAPAQPAGDMQDIEPGQGILPALNPDEDAIPSGFADPSGAAQDIQDAVADAAQDIAEKDTKQETDPDEADTSPEKNGQEENDTLPKASGAVSGLYIVDYASAVENGGVNLNLAFESDLLAVSQQLDTVIYDFHDDGSVTIYDKGTLRQGNYSAAKTHLTILSEGQDHTYSYEVDDGLLILQEDDKSFDLYHFNMDNGAVLDDYSTIEIDQSLTYIPDSYVDTFISNILKQQTKEEVITDGVTKKGDLITISFVGTLEGEKEPFEGGSGENYTFELGSGALIGNYEEQLTGKKIGDTVDVTVTFPEDYEGPEELKGKTATFVTTIESKKEVDAPELTDAWVRSYTQEYFPEKLDTVEQFRQYCKDYQRTNALHTAIFQALAKKLEDVEYRNNVMTQMLLNYASRHLQETAKSCGMDVDTFAKQMGYSSAENYAQYEASSNIMSALIIDRVMQDLGIHYNQDDLRAKLEEDVKLSYGSTMSADDYIAQSGAVGMWAYTNLQYKYGLVTSALEERTVLLPGGEEETSSAASAAAGSKQP